MIRILGALGFLASIAAAQIANAQQTLTLPTIVQSRIDDDTVLVARVDLKRPGTVEISKFLSECPDPTGSFGRRTTQSHRALQDLIARKVGELFLVVSTYDLPVGGATIIVPSSGNEEELAAIATSLKLVWPEDVQVVSQGVVVASKAMQFVSHKPVERSELSKAFATVKEEQIQVAVSFGVNARRVLREFSPSFPAEFGGGSIAPLTEGWEWLAIGVSPSTKPSLKMILQAKNATAAEALEKNVNATLKFAAQSEAVKSLVGSSSAIVGLMTPTRKNDQIVLSLTEASGDAARLVDELATPLLIRWEKRSIRSQSINNMKTILLAMHNYLDHNKGVFPPGGSRSKEGKPLLSWRVLILPWLDEGELFSQFHLDEPWDSEHNSKLITKMPAVYASANITREQRTKGMTTYVGPVAEKTLFGSGDGVTIRQITDGTSNTIAFVDANSDRAVIWSKPSDLDVDLKEPSKGLMGQEGGLFWSGLSDGSVRSIPSTISAETLRYLFQINDGHPIPQF